MTLKKKIDVIPGWQLLEERDNFIHVCKGLYPAGPDSQSPPFVKTFPKLAKDNC